MATETPLPSIISESEAAMIAVDFPYVLLTKETGGSARGNINLTHPSPLPACYDTILTTAEEHLENTMYGAVKERLVATI